MNKILAQVKQTKGYVSIETIVVAGLVIGIGVVAFMAFQKRANKMTNDSLNRVETATNSSVVNSVQ